MVGIVMVIIKTMMKDYLAWASQHSSHSGSENIQHAPGNYSSQ